MSYAQNFEDVMLVRALGHIARGFYVDVGAQDPVVDSVSRAFYERSWRGVHIEPLPVYADRLRKDRPGDVILEFVAGSSEQEIDFYEIPETGLSTADREIAARNREQGFEVIDRVMPCRTLDHLLENYLEQDIHWLKIDVEGFEQEVIEGWHSNKLKPWIVVVESTLPNSPVESYSGWEPLLLVKGYSYVYFDGLNRFYVSDQHSELVEHFDRPPNYFDDFSLSRRSAFNSTVTKELVELEQKVAEINEQLIHSKQREHDLSVQLTDVEQREHDLIVQLTGVQQREHDLGVLLEAVYASWSWRLTSPLRAIAKWLGFN